MGGIEKLRLVDARTGNTIEIDVTPDMSPDEIVNKLVEKGVVGRDEPVVFGFINEEGKLDPRQFGCARDLIDASNMRVVGFEAQRVQGNTIFKEHMRRYGRGRGFRWNSMIEGYVAEYLSKYDGKIYLIIIKPKPGYPDIEPDIYIYPYPDYVRYDSKFEENHIRQCLWEETTETGEVVGYLHIDPFLWDEAVERCENPLAFILDTLIQLIDLVPTYRAYR